MFQKMKNIDSAFKLIRSFSLLFVVCCAIVCFIVTYKAFQMVSASQHRIYILANGKALEAFAADRKDNIPVEARDHIKMFHHHFFTLDPDEKVIQSNMVKALYLADASAKREYDNLKEAGYYANLISGNISQTIEADTIQVDTHRYPYYFRYVGIQTLVRPSAVVTRSLITEGYLRNVSRSDHNAHGFLIEKWRTLENKDLTIQAR